MLILVIVLGVFLGILGWKAVEAGAKVLVFVAAVSGVVWLIGFLLQNLFLLFLCVIGAVYIILAIYGAPRRHAVNEQGSGHVAANIAAEATGIYPSVAFTGYHSPWYNPFDMKHFVVAKEGETVWLIEFNPFSCEAIEGFQIPAGNVSFEVKNRLLIDKITIKTPEKSITLNVGKQYRQEVGKLFDVGLRPDLKMFSEQELADLQLEPKTFSEQELQEIIYGQPPEDFVKQLKEWRKDHSSQPEIEYWYRNYQTKGKVLPRPLLEWEKEAEDYIPRGDKARLLEKEGDLEGALKIYLDIIEQYNPSGTAYYESPAFILERLGRFEEATAVYEKALYNPYLVGSYGKFEQRLNRLQRR